MNLESYISIYTYANVSDQSKSCNQYDYFWITKVVDRIWRWSNELKNIFFKYWKTFNIFRGRIQVVPFNNSKLEKTVFEKILFCIEKRNFIHISCSVWCTSYRNDFKQINVSIFVLNKWHCIRCTCIHNLKEKMLNFGKA